MSWLRAGWIAAFAVLAGVRLWNGFTGPLLRGYDDHGHVGYVFYLDLYRSIPWAHQGWSYFHPPLHYLFGWAFAQLGSPEALLHGLALLNGLWSLAIAWIASRVTRLACPGREGLQLLVFVSVGLLPVYLYTSTMAGNELTAAFFGTSAFALFISNECRSRPSLRIDALVGLLLGLALLTKVSAVVVLGAVGLALALRLLRAQDLRASVPRLLLRGALLAGIAIVVASPYYGRNVLEYGTPFKMSRDNPHVARLESLQGPGSRSWVDFVQLPADLIADPNPASEHMLHSVWGSAYAGTWVDSRKAWDTLPKENQSRIRTVRSAMAILGIGPTLLVLVGASLALRDMWRRRRREVYVPIFCIAGTSLAVFAIFAVAAPQFSALKASYLLGLTLPYAVFLARGVEAVGRGSRRAAWGVAASALVVGPALASALVSADGAVLPTLGNQKAVGSMMFYFGDYEGARAFYQERRRVRFPPGTWSDDLASVALFEGDVFEARSLLELRPPRVGVDPFRWNAVGVAAALSGDHDVAVESFDRAIDAGAGEVALTNRGVLHGLRGSFGAAESDLRAALELDPSLAPAWQALAEVLEGSGRSEAAREARANARRAAGRAPRAHPYGIPDGLGQYPSFSLALRFMLWLDGGRLSLARAPFRSHDAIAMQDPAALLAARPHVVLIVVDTLRADHLGAYGYPRATSPHIDRLAREGVRFANAWAPSSWTLPSVASLFTAQPPEVHGVAAWGQKLELEDTTFVERLRAAGYHTVGVSGNFVHVTEKTRFDQGFDTWKTLSEEVEDAEKEPLFTHRGTRLREPTASDVNEAVLERLPEAGPRPLFLYVHYMEPHSAYDPPEEKRRAFASRPADRDLSEPVTSEYLAQLVRGEREITPEERRRMIDLYDAEIATVDEAIGALLATLEERGFGEKLVVAVTSDHGEAFGEHGSWFHGLNLYRESLSVPFILWDSRTARSEEVVAAPVDLLDVPATLLALAGVEPMPGISGRNLLDPGTRFRRPLLSALGPDELFENHLRPRSDRRAAIHWPWKIVVDLRSVPRLYQLEQDPGETRPLALDDPRVPPRLRKRATQLAASDPPQRGRRKPRLPTAVEIRDLEKLRALGYAE